MKTILKLCMIGLLGNAAMVGFQARADLEVTASLGIHSAGDFYGPLSASGAWISVGGYGRCWRPTGVELGWRPYCNGEWVWTDCGWYWQSAEPWAWACYHYGCWYSDPSLGWVWVPGTEWAPAWVTWRSGGGYIGWAPMPPRGISVALIGPQFVFVQAGQFQDPIRPSLIIVNNTTILERTKVFNNITRETREVAGGGRHKVVINQGPGMEIVQKATGRRISTVPIQEAARRAAVPARRTAAPENEIRNNNLRNNPVPGTPTPEPHQGIIPRENQRPLVQPNPAEPRRSVPNEIVPPREMQPRDTRPAPPQREQPIPERGLAPGGPAKLPPSELPKLPPNETHRNAPGAPPALNPNTTPGQPERLPPQPQPREREERER
jgi:hypothetical protein